MTSGVYKLTFSNGDNYIGKSVDIENRWKQHADKFRKGTAAKNMQDAFNKYGYPDTEIMITCHEDHIDILEACLISRLNPTLNSSRPSDPLVGLYNVNFDTFLNFLDLSTLQHVKKIVDLMNDAVDHEAAVKEKDSQIVKLESNILQLRKARTDEEIQKDINKRISRLQKEKDNLLEMQREQASVLEAAQRELIYLRRPWWQKIFA